MKAVVMAGGEGTALRPMTANQPKPLLPVVNRPIMEHVLRLLKRHGFTETVVTVQFLAALDPQLLRRRRGARMSLQLRHRGDAARHRRQRQERRGRAPGRPLPGDLRRRPHRHRPHRHGRASTRRTARWSPSGSSGCPTRWSSASSSSTTTAASSGSWRSRPGARCSPTPSTPASTSWSPRSSTTSRPASRVDWSGDVFPQLLERGQPRSTATSPTATGRTSAPTRATSRPRPTCWRARSTSRSTASRCPRASGWPRAPRSTPTPCCKGPLYIGDYAKVEAGAELREYTVLGSNVVVQGGRVPAPRRGPRQRLHRPAAPTCAAASIGKNTDVMAGGPDRGGRGHRRRVRHRGRGVRLHGRARSTRSRPSRPAPSSTPASSGSRAASAPVRRPRRLRAGQRGDHPGARAYGWPARTPPP